MPGAADGRMALPKATNENIEKSRREYINDKNVQHANLNARTGSAVVEKGRNMSGM
jgi:predicted RecA/RadA family phage recombinase